jgi:hypothetical protein
MNRSLPDLAMARPPTNGVSEFAPQTLAPLTATLRDPAHDPE